jgi:hypothetical protein
MDAARASDGIPAGRLSFAQSALTGIREELELFWLATAARLHVHVRAFCGASPYQFLVLKSALEPSSAGM